MPENAEPAAFQGQRVPPQSLEAEQSVLGAVLLDRDAIARAAEILQASDFYRDVHRQLFSVILELQDRNEPVDLVTLSEALKSKGELDAVGGPAGLADLTDRVPTAANVEYYAQIVRRKALLRKLISVSTGIIQDAYDNPEDADLVLDLAESKILEVGGLGEQKNAILIEKMMSPVIKKIEDMKNNQGDVTGIPTGYHQLDQMTMGLQPGEMVIIAARPAMGKTALGLNIARNVAKHFRVQYDKESGGHEKPEGVAVFSLEMSSESLLMRLLASERRIDGLKLRSGRLHPNEFHRLTMGAGDLYKLPLFVDDSSGLDVQTMRAKARRLVKEHRIKLFVIDYLQLMTSAAKKENRQQEVSDISRQLKAMAKELSVSVVVISQLSRGPEQRSNSKKKGERPKLSDLRESGAIEQDADVVMFIFRESYYASADDDGDNEPVGETEAELIIAKQRSGPVGTVKLVWLNYCTRFENPAPSSLGMGDGPPPAGV